MRRFLIQPSSISSAGINLLLCIYSKVFSIATFLYSACKAKEFLKYCLLSCRLKGENHRYCLTFPILHSLFSCLYFALDVYVIAYYEPLIALIYAYSTSPIVFTADFFGPVYDQKLWRHPLLKIWSKRCLQQLEVSI